MFRILCIALALLTFSAQAAEFKIATFNTESDPDTDPAKVAETIAAIGEFDILALQEVDGADALKTYTNAVAAARSGRWRYVISESAYYADREPDLLGIIYPTEVYRQLETSELHLIRSRPDGTTYGDPDWGLRGALALRLQHIPSGQEFQVVTMHLKCCGGEGEEIRAHQSALLAEWIVDSGLTTILLGDSNIPIEPGEAGATGPNAPAFQNLTTVSFLTWVAPLAPVKTQCDPDFNSMLDQIYVANDFAFGATTDVLFDEATYCDKDAQGYSDHRPVVATIPSLFATAAPVVPGVVDDPAALEEREFLLQRSGRPDDAVAQ